MLAHRQTQMRINKSTHQPGEGEGGVKAANEVADIVALLWQRCAGVARLLNKWIWNDLPRVSATWAQTHALLAAFTHNTTPPSPLRCSYGDADAKAHTNQRQGKREKSGTATTFFFFIVLTHTIWNADSPALTEARFQVDTLLEVIHLLSNMRKTYDKGKSKNTRLPDLCLFSNNYHIEYPPLHSNKGRFCRGSIMQDNWLRDIWTTAAAVTYRLLKLIHNVLRLGKLLKVSRLKDMVCGVALTDQKCCSNSLVSL